MKANTRGILVATAVAPYLVATCFPLAGSLVRGNFPGADNFRLSLGFISNVVLFGTYGLVIFGLPLLWVASFAAYFIEKKSSGSMPTTLLIGAVTGSVFGLPLIIYSVPFEELARGWGVILCFALLGTICGWIYWLIARKRTPERPHAIDRP
jgi:hypothetical protein